MSDLFISYAREDTAPVRRLHDRLVERECDTWVDWEGIAPSAEWLEEIYAAIDGAGMFVQVLSPDSVASVVCTLELDHAVNNNKRLIAIVCRDVPTESVPPALAQVNWIFLRDGDDFDAGVEALTTALALDLDWARVHTRLLVRAVEWERRGRARALCLKGGELSENAKWLARIGDRQPQPTGLQREYLSASRTLARRLRAVAVTVAAAVAAVGAVLWWQADRQGAISAAQRIVADAGAARIAAPDRSTDELLLAMEGMGRLRALGVTSLAADGALRGALEGLPKPVVTLARAQPLGSSDGWIHGLAFTASGRLLASYGDGALLDWRFDGGVESQLDAWSGRPDAVVAGAGMLATPITEGVVIRAMASGEPVLVHLPEREDALALSPDGKLIAYVSTGSGAVVVMDAGTGTILGSAVPGTAMERVSRLAVGNDGKRVAMVRLDQVDMIHRRYEVSILDLASKRLTVLIESESQRGNIVFSPDGARLALASGAGAALVFDVASGKIERRIAIGREVDHVAFGPRGTRLATLAGSVAQVWDVATGVELVRLGLPRLEPPVVFSPDGTLLALHQLPATIRVYAARAPGEGFTLVHSGPVNSVAVDGRGRVAAGTGTVEGKSEMALWNALTGDRIRTWPLEDFTLGERVGFDRGGGVLMLREAIPISCQGVTRLWDLDADRELARVEHWICGEPAALGPHGKRLAYTNGQGPTEVLDLSSGKTRILDQHGASILAFDAAGDHLAASFENGKLRVWRTDSWAVQREWDARAHLLALDAHGTRLAAATADRHVTLWGLASDAGGRVLGHLGRVTGLAFSPDGTALASAAADGFARIWDAVNGEERARLLHAGGVNAVAFSSDGTRLVTGSEDGSARVWSWPGAVEVARMTHGAAVNTLAIAPDGRSLVTGGRDGTVRRWLLRTDDLLADACSRLGSAGRPEAWDDFLRARLTAPLCPPATPGSLR